MPLKKFPKHQPLWKEKEFKSLKKGLHHTVYSVNGDSYKGEWNQNQKNGPGTYIWKGTGAIYDGVWKDDLRNGFGMLSLPNKDGGMRRVYTGGWLYDKKHGYGTYFYSDEKYYEGEWYQNQRCGWGRMFYEDGSIYEGEWDNDKRNGCGMLRLPNDNRYEGMWLDDKKHGDGRFYHLDKGQIFIGTWIEDISKCGMMEDFDRESAVDPTQYPIQELKLKDYEKVVQDTTLEFITKGLV